MVVAALRRAATLSSLESVWAEVGAADERRRCARVYTTRFLLITCQRPPNTRRGPDPKQQQHRPALLPAEEELRALLARLDSRRLQIELLMGLADYSTHPKRPLQGRPEWTPRGTYIRIHACTTTITTLRPDCYDECMKPASQPQAVGLSIHPSRAARLTD